MSHKTPQFDALLAQYYAEQQPGRRTCSETGEEFDIPEHIFDAYKKRRVPLPTIAPHIRFRRQRAHMGGIELFMRTTVDDKPIVSMYDPDSPALLMDNGDWHADSFDAMKYGQDIDPHTSFFEQWKQFSKTVPRPAIETDINSQNCNWSLYELRFKDSYATYGGVECDDIMYGDMCLWSSHAADVTNIVRSEWIYDATNVDESSHVLFSENCTACLESYFCFGCGNCSNCFGCVNLKNRQYCFFNKQLTKEEYEAHLSKIDLTDTRIVSQLKDKIDTLWQQGYHDTEQNINCEHVMGDLIIGSNNTLGISVAGCERTYNVFDASDITDSCDICTSSNTEMSYNSLCITNGSQNNMSLLCFQCLDVEYCELCSSCEHCFGCIGLTRKKFCIFNKQYEEDEYWRIVDQIKSNMFTSGEYGQFFPYHTSLIAYNVSHADVFFPLAQQQLDDLQARNYTFPKADITKALPIDQLPNKLENVTDDILQKQFICPQSERPFRIVKPELDFHRTINIALPRVHSSIRRKHRYKKMLGLQLYTDTCGRCQKNIWTRQTSSTTTHLLCSTCYQQQLMDNKPH